MPPLDHRGNTLRTYIRKHGIALAPRELRELQATFDQAWRHRKPGADTAELRDGLAQEIVRQRQRGVRDPKRLTALAIAWITARNG